MFFCFDFPSQPCSYILCRHLQLRELDLPLLHPTQHRLLDIIRLQHGGVPHGGVVQPLGHRLVTAVVQDLLCAEHSDRRLGCNQRRQLQSLAREMLASTIYHYRGTRSSIYGSWDVTSGKHSPPSPPPPYPPPRDSPTPLASPPRPQKPLHSTPPP